MKIKPFGLAPHTVHFHLARGLPEIQLEGTYGYVTNTDSHLRETPESYFRKTS